ncbi:TRAP transporter substrate-binding protein DctP [Pelagibius sp. CAU 1746]|uniref:TRAP transporter substrate-binding protein DctP n=1 Tax=Pelagibius sp. CAU 1746 TaxID=3140370 RepID=UPI00325A94D2
MTTERNPRAGRRAFLAGTAAGLAVGAGAGAGLVWAAGRRASGGAPAVISGREVGTTWKIQTSWPGGVGLEVFKAWCASIVEKTSGELAFEGYGANELVGEFQLFDALRRGNIQAMNSFTQYWSGRIPAAVFLAAYPLGLRQPHEWEVFYYGLGGLEMAREIYAPFGMYYLGPVRHGANIIHSKKPIRSISDFRDLRLRMPGGMVAELFQAAGAKTTMLPGSEILDALANDVIDAADYVGPAVNLALGFQKVAKYVSMGPPGFMSIYQPVDLMDITVALESWRALSAGMQSFLEDEVRIYSQQHHVTIERADQAAWEKFGDAGVEVSRLSDEDVTAFTKLAVPRWFAWANRDPDAARVFRTHLDYMMSGTLGYVTPEMIQGFRLNT